MPNQFSQHYTREEARDLLPQVRNWIRRLQTIEPKLKLSDQQISSVIQSGQDAGGALVHQSIRNLAELREILFEFKKREIFLKDVERGLVDFPSFVQGREVFLCWELDEEDVEFWHDIDTGYSGREKLSE